MPTQLGPLTFTPEPLELRLNGILIGKFTFNAPTKVRRSKEQICGLK